MGEAVIDEAIFAALEATAGAEFVADLVDTFVEEASGMLAELRSARVAKDAGRFRRAAHSLKSDSGTFGALTLAALARELELNGLSDDPARDEVALASLEAELTRAAAALKELVRG
jgi:HPt (histidine-containing phosphotransfer) domain-containing protein